MKKLLTFLTALLFLNSSVAFCAYSPKNDNGQETMANSEPVVIASDQSAIPSSQSGTWNITNVSGTVSLPTGASTSAKQDTGNTSLASIDSKITAVNTGAVVVSSSALPSGASTAANQTTIIGHVDGVEGILGTIDADTGNISTKIDTIAGAVSGTEMQVDVVSSALPTGAATEATLSTLGATDFMLGTDFSSVFGTGTLVTTTQADDLANTLDGVNGTSFTYLFDGSTWDRAPGDSTNGMLVNLGANNDITGTVTANAGTNLNTSALALESGGNLAASATSLAALDNAVSGNELQVDIVTSALPTGASTLAEQQTQTTALQLIDNPVSVLGTATYTEATSSGFLMGAVRRDADTTLVNTTNEVAPLQVDANGRLKVEAFSGETLPVSGTVTVTDGAGSLNVIVDSGTVTTVSTVSALGISTTGPQKAEDVASANGDMGIAVFGIRDDTLDARSGTEGDWEPFHFNANGAVWVDPVTGAVEDAGETAGQRLNMVGTVRRDTAASSAGTTGDNATLNTDQLGRTWVRNGDPCADYARITSVAIDTATSGNVELVALQSGQTIYVCGYSIVADAAVQVQFIYGTGTACATGETNLTGDWSLAANGGITQTNSGFPQFKTASANALCVELSGAVQINGHVTYVQTSAP